MASTVFPLQFRAHVLGELLLEAGLSSSILPPGMRISTVFLHQRHEKQRAYAARKKVGDKCMIGAHSPPSSLFLPFARCVGKRNAATDSSLVICLECHLTLGTPQLPVEYSPSWNKYYDGIVAPYLEPTTLSDCTMSTAARRRLMRGLQGKIAIDWCYE